MHQHVEDPHAHRTAPEPPVPQTGRVRRLVVRRSPRAALLWGFVAAALAIGPSACGGGSPQTSGVASVTTTSDAHAGSTTTTTTRATTASTKPDPLAYAQCMRTHGIPNFPDPNATGQIVFNVGGGGIDPQSPQFQAAQAACKHYLGSGASSPGNAGTPKKVLLAYAKCMRAHGVTDFPDPVSFPSGQWGFTLRGQITQTSPSFQAANRKCKSRNFGGIHPCSGGGGGGSLRSRFDARRC